MIVEEIQGNLLETTVGVIAHGVNCQNKMGSGVAKALYSKWPEIKARYHKYCDCLIKSNFKNEKLLGNIDSVKIKNGPKVINCFTQLYYGYDGRKYVSYDAIYDCFRKLALDYSEIAIPKIGCGLAGGDWEIVRAIINSATGEHCKVYVYYL
jgi:O-acetyl-ADP-ribose deacetylase (regulator of RNase III)